MTGRKEIFLAYPFDVPSIEETVRRVIEGGGLGHVSVASDQLDPTHLLEKIERMMENSDLCLFDLTGHNANVALELGLAKANRYDYRVMYCTDPTLNARPGRSSDVFSDLRGYDSIRYADQGELEAKLREHLPGTIAASGTRKMFALNQLYNELTAIDRELRVKTRLGGTRGPFIMATTYEPGYQTLSTGRYEAYKAGNALQSLDPEVLGALGDAYGKVETLVAYEADYHRAVSSMVASNDAKIVLRNAAGPTLDAIERALNLLRERLRLSG
jgi:hypothetical protein